VALARALAPNPQLLLLDEPLSALDAKLRKSLRSEIRRIQQELGITTIYVTHDQEEALVLADRIAVMNRGEIEQVGSPRAIYENPVNRFVASFVGDSNLIPARLLAREGDYARVETSLGEFRSLFPRESQRIPREPPREGKPMAKEGVLLFRPESCKITDPTENPKHQNTQFISGVADGVEYLGSATAFTLRSANGQAVKVKVAGGLALTPGSRAAVSIDPGDCILLP